MTLYNFLLAFLSAGTFFFAMYYLFVVIYIRKKINDKYFYFVISCFLTSFYILFQLLLSLPFTDAQYLVFHKLKLASGTMFNSFWFFVLYECYFPKAKKYIPMIFLFIFLPIILVSIPFDIFSSLPITTYRVDTSFSTFIYHYGQSNLMYRFFSVVYTLSIIASLVYFIFSKTEGKKIHFLIIIIGATLAALNDMLTTQSLIRSIYIVEYFLTLIVGFVFFEFLLEDRRTYLSVAYLKEEAERRLKITEVYTRKSIVESIRLGNDPTKFTPETIHITTLFTDIRNYTGIAEGLEPLEVVELLNSYFDSMNSTIIKYNGEIDKLIGDCIMALFRNPDNALRSAIEMRHQLARFNSGSRIRVLNNGTGLNCGEVVIGNIGSASKMDYTVVGDIVNTASRMESLTKYYKTPVIISDDLKKKLNGNYKLRFLDEVLVKGKSHPVRIYEVFDFETPDVIALKNKNAEHLLSAYNYYRDAEFLKAIDIYERLMSSSAEPVLEFYHKRCRLLQSAKQNGTLDGWKGIFEFMDK